MKFKAVLEHFHNDLWGHHIVVPQEVVEECKKDNVRRFICRLMDREEFQCGILPKGDGTWFININKKLRSKLGLVEGSEIWAELRKDDSKYGMPLPEELAEIFRQDPEGDKVFHALTPGKQRSFIYMVNNLKNPESRLRKAVVIINYLKSCGGNIVYKDLMDAFREANWK